MIPTLQVGQIGRSRVQVAGMLDHRTPSLACVLSHRKRLTAYGGSCFRVRESGGNTEADIGFAGVAYDTAAQAAHVGANSGYARQWYDQSGNGQNFGNSSSGNQPRLVNAGTYSGLTYFDGSNDGLVSANSSGSIPGITIYMRGTLRSLAALVMLLEMSTDHGFNTNAIAFYYINGSGTIGFIRRGGLDYGRRTTSNVSLDGSVWCCVINPALTSGTSGVVIYDSAVSLATTSTAASSNANPIGSFLYYLGARNSGASLPAPLDLTDLVIYNEAHSAATVAEIGAILDMQ